MGTRHMSLLHGKDVKDSPGLVLKTENSAPCRGPRTVSRRTDGGPIDDELEMVLTTEGTNRKRDPPGHRDVLARSMTKTSYDINDQELTPFGRKNSRFPHEIVQFTSM